MDHWAEVFRALGNHDRLRLFTLLAHQKGGCCVCELVEALGLPQYQVSKHLRALRRVGLIASVRVGRWAYYAVNHTDVSRETAALVVRVVPRPTIADAIARLHAAVSRRVAGRCVSKVSRAGDTNA